MESPVEINFFASRHPKYGGERRGTNASFGGNLVPKMGWKQENPFGLLARVLAVDEAALHGDHDRMGPIVRL